MLTTEGFLGTDLCPVRVFDRVEFSDVNGNRELVGFEHCPVRVLAQVDIPTFVQTIVDSKTQGSPCYSSILTLYLLLEPNRQRTP